MTERASLGPNGQIADFSFAGVISANGRYVAFVTSASLDPRDDNQTSDVYVRDRLRATTTLVSIEPGQATVFPDSSSRPAISGDGRYIAFDSVTTLLGGEGTSRAAVVVDRGPVDANGDFTATPVEHVIAGLANGACTLDISGDGSQVTYSTCGDNAAAFVVDEDANGNGIPYEAGDAAAPVALEPPASTGVENPRISADGRHVVFDATTVLDAATNTTAQVVWAYDRQLTGSGAKDLGNSRYLRITSGDFTPLVNGDGRSDALENTTAEAPVANGDGSVVAYSFHYSNAVVVPNLVLDPDPPRVLNSPFAINTPEIVVVHRDASGNVASTDVASEIGGTPPVFGDADSSDPDISDDGRYVTFDTHAQNLLPHPATDACEGPCDVAVVADIDAPDHAGRPQVIGPSADPANTIGGMPESSEFDTSISADGRFILFNSSGNDLLPFVTTAAAGLVSPDTNNQSDVFLRELRPVDPPVPATVDFGSVPVGTSSVGSTVQFTTNDFGPAPILSVSLAGANPGDFHILGTTGCAPPLADAPAAPVAAAPNYAIIHIDTPCVVLVNFVPTAFGTRTAELQVVTGTPFPATDPEGLPIPAGTPPSRTTTSVPLTGGAGPGAFQVTPVPLDFGLQTLGQLTADAPLTVRNTGGNSFSISTVTITGPNPADFTITSDQCSGAVLNPGATCVVRAAFHSTGPGDRSAFVQFVDTAGGSPHVAPLVGRTPLLITNPGVVAPGRTVDVIGMSWLPGQTVVLTTVDTRDPAHVFSEKSTATADAAGTFRASMVMFPKTTPGSRFVIGTGVAPAATARASLLVVFATVQAPNFLTRG